MPSRYRPNTREPEESPGAIKQLLEYFGIYNGDKVSKKTLSDLITETPASAAEPSAVPAPAADYGDARGGKVIPAILRGAAGFFGETPWTGAAASAIADVPAQMIEKRTLNPFNIDPKQLAAETALGATYGGVARTIGGAVKAGRTGLAMLRGGAAASAAPVIRHTIAEGDPNPLNYPGEVVTSGLLGAGTAGLFSRFRRPGGPESLSIDPRNIPPDVPPPSTPPVAPDPKKYMNKSGLRVALDDLKAVPHNDPTLMPNSTSVTPEVLAKHKALALEQARNPKGPIAAEIGRPLTKTGLNARGEPIWAPPSVSDMETLHMDANATVEKANTAVTKAQSAEATQIERNEKARRKFITDHLAQDTRNERAREAYILKNATQESKNLNAGEKAIEKDQTQTARNETTRARFMKNEQAETARSLNKQQAFRRKLEVDAELAKREDAKRTLDVTNKAEAQRRMDEFKNREGGVEVGPQSSTETIRVDTPGGTETLRQTTREKPPPVDEKGNPIGGGPLPDAEPPSPRIPKSRGEINTHTFPTQKLALEAAAANGGGTIHFMKDRQWRVTLNPEGGPIPPPGSVPHPAPATTPTKPTPSAAAAEPSIIGSVPGIERGNVTGRSYSKREAAAVAKLAHGTPRQVSPSKWVVDLPEPEGPAVAPSPASTAPAQPLPEGPFKPSTPYTPTTEPTVKPFDTGSLTDKEYTRMLELRGGPGRPRRTPAEEVEFKALNTRFSKRPAPTAEVTDYTSGDTPTLDVEPPAPTEPAELDPQALTDVGPKMADFINDEIPQPGKTQKLPPGRKTPSNVIDVGATSPEVPEKPFVSGAVDHSKLPATPENVSEEQMHALTEMGLTPSQIVKMSPADAEGLLGAYKGQPTGPDTVNFRDGDPMEWTKETIADMDEFPDLSKGQEPPPPAEPTPVQVKPIKPKGGGSSGVSVNTDNHFTEYKDAATAARERANRTGLDVAIRKSSKYDKPGFTVKFAAKNDSDYALAEIVKPKPLPGPSGHLADPELSVPEFAKGLAKEGAKPIAEVPYSLTGETAKTPKPVEPSLFGGKGAKLAESQEGADKLQALSDAIHGEDSTPRINPEGHGMMPAEPTPRKYKGDAGQFNTLADEQAGYPKTREALAGYDDAQLVKEQREMLKASFDRMFGHNAKKMLKLIENELESRGLRKPTSTEVVNAATKAEAAKPENVVKRQALKDSVLKLAEESKAKLSEEKGSTTPPVKSEADAKGPVKGSPQDTAEHWARQMSKLRDQKPHSIAKRFGKKGPTPEQAETYRQESSEWSAAYRHATNRYKGALQNQKLPSEGAAEKLQKLLTERATPEPSAPAPAKAEGGAIPVRLYKDKQQALGRENPFGYAATEAAEKAGEIPKTDPKYGKDSRGRPVSPARMQGAELFKTRPRPEVPPAPTTPQGKPIAEMTDAELKAEVDAFKQANPRKGEKGEASVGVAARVLGAGAGAAIGATQDDENPLRGAAIGAGIGLGGVSAASHLGPLLKGEQTLKEWTDPVVARVPNLFRGGLLSDPRSVFHNSIAGPWGSHFLGGGVEQYLKGVVTGDASQREVGKAAMKSAVNIPKWLKGYGESFGDAMQKVHDVDEVGRAGAFVDAANPTMIDRAAEYPAIAMLAGDLNGKNFMAEAGISDEAIRAISNTDEPKRALWKSMTNWTKAKSGKNDTGEPSTIAKMMSPFTRTAANIMENGTERTPGLGWWINEYGNPELKIPAKEMWVQQGVGGIVFSLGMAAGYNTDEDVAKMGKIGSLVANLGGNYALLSGTGFLAGQAMRNGDTTLKAVFKAFVKNYGAQGEMPMPSGRIITDTVAPFKRKFYDDEDVPLSDFVPSAVIPKIVGFGQEMYDLTKDSGSSNRPARPPLANSRYRPPRK